MSQEVALDARGKLGRKEMVFLVAATVSNVGGSAALLALTIIAADAGDSVGNTGMATALMLAILFTSSTVFLPYLSFIVKRFGTLKGFAYVQILASVTFLIEALLIALGVPAYPVVLVGALVNGACTGWTLAFSQLVLRAYSLPGDHARSAARLTTASGAAVAVGAPLAGLLIDNFGPAWCLFINALSFVPVAIVALKMKPVAAVDVPPRIEQPWRSAYGAVREREQLRTFCLIAAFTALVIGPLSQMLVPVSRGLGHNLAVHAGILFGFVAAGAILTPLAVRMMRSSSSRFTRGVRGYGLAGILLVILAIFAIVMDGNSELFVIGVVLMIFFAFTKAAHSYIIALTVESTDDAHRTLDMSTYFMAVSIGLPIGALFWGFLIDQISTEVTLIGFGLLVVAAMVVFGFKYARRWE